MRWVRKSLVVVFLIVVLAVFAWVVYYRASSHESVSPMVPTVSVSVVKQEETQGQVTAVGTLQPYRGINLIAQADAVVSHIYFPSNASVNAGDVVMEQESNTQAAEVKQAQVEMTLAKANYDRGIGLYKEHYLSQQEFEQLEEKYLYAQASYHRAEAELNKRIVTAPFQGQLGILEVQEGDYASKGELLVTLTDLDKLTLDFFIPEKYINHVKKGDRIQIKSAIYPNKTFTASVDLLNTIINKQTYMLKVRATVDNKEHFLKPGGFANITVYYGSKHKVLTVPQTAIVYSNKGNYVYKVAHNTVQAQQVTLGIQTGQAIIIETGLNLGDTIVTAGTNKLRDGMSVKLSNQSQQ